jgi:uncharacterized membrane protein YdfJ with MMPL/SSD domain
LKSSISPDRRGVTQRVRAFAFALGVGLLVHTFIVRALLVPSLIAFFGDAAGWPRRRATQLAEEPA